MVRGSCKGKRTSPPGDHGDFGDQTLERLLQLGSVVIGRNRGAAAGSRGLVRKRHGRTMRLQLLDSGVTRTATLPAPHARSWRATTASSWRARSTAFWNCCVITRTSSTTLVPWGIRHPARGGGPASVHHSYSPRQRNLLPRPLYHNRWAQAISPAQSSATDHRPGATPADGVATGPPRRGHGSRLNETGSRTSCRRPRPGSDAPRDGS